MKRFHTPLLAVLQAEKHHWKLSGRDNWFAFDESQAQINLEKRVIAWHTHAHTPPSRSMIYNDLDIGFHGTMKLHQNADRASTCVLRCMGGHASAVPARLMHT